MSGYLWTDHGGRGDDAWARARLRDGSPAVYTLDGATRRGFAVRRGPRVTSTQLPPLDGYLATADRGPEVESAFPTTDLVLAFAWVNAYTWEVELRPEVRFACEAVSRGEAPTDAAGVVEAFCDRRLRRVRLCIPEFRNTTEATVTLVEPGCYAVVLTRAGRPISDANAMSARDAVHRAASRLWDEGP